jgi:hypothetical protein
VRLEGFEPPTRGLGKRGDVLHRIAENCESRDGRETAESRAEELLQAVLPLRGGIDRYSTGPLTFTLRLPIEEVL